MTSVWSFFYGLYGFEASQNLDGSVVFGGYDAAKITGMNHTFNMTLSSGCDTSLVVDVADILMDMDGNSVSITGGTGQLPTMCIDPSFRLLSMPSTFYEALAQGMNSTDLLTNAGIAIGGKAFLREGMYIQCSLPLFRA